MDEMKRAQEMSFLRPHHSVDLAERVLASEQDCVVCVSSIKSKTFIAFNVSQGFWRKSEKCGKIILLVDDEKATIVEPFLTGISEQSLLSAKAFFSKTAVEDEWNFIFSMYNIIVTTGKAFAWMLIARTVDLSSCSLIIFDECHLALKEENHFAVILKQMELSKLDSRPQIVGLSSQILHHQDCSKDTEIFLTSLEQIFHCKTFVSSDLLALNQYGEYTEMEICCFTSSHVQDQRISNLSDILQSALLFLKGYRIDQVTDTCVAFVRHVLTEGYRVLLLLGSWCTLYVAKIIVKEIEKLAKKSIDNEIVLILQFCRTQISLVISILEQEKLEISENDLTDLGTILLFRTSMHLKPEHQQKNDLEKTSDTDQSLCKEPNQSTESLVTGQNPSCERQDNPQATNHSEVQASYGTKTQCNDPLCVILVPSTIVAKALNSLLKKLSSTVFKYNFLRSACIYGNKAKQEMKESNFSEEVDDSVMVCVQDGSVNVLVATFEIEQELYAKRCSLLIRLGMPNTYKSYYSIKSKLKSAAGNLVVLVREEELLKTEEKYQTFQRIEKLLMDRCPNSRPLGSEIRKLFQESLVDVYQPFGEVGAEVDLLSSIALVNSYCSKFPSGGMGNPVPVCRIQEVWSDQEVKFVAMLHLPRNSPVYQPTKGSVTLKRTDINEDEVRKARVKCEMLAALEACRLLHVMGELTDDLQPVFRLRAYNLTAQHEPCAFEVADGGVGMDGTIKRNRAYRKKFPTLLENNFPVCDEPCYVYALTMELTKPLNFERAVRSRSKMQSTSGSYSLGILSRKQLPKLPCMAIFDRAGEVTASVTECCPYPIVLTADQLSLLQRFTEYIFKEIARPKKESPATFISFDPTIASSGYYIALLKDVSSRRSLAGTSRNNHKEIAFDFIFSLESKLVSFKNPVYPGPPDITNAEIFRDAVVTASYNEKRSHYYVAEICYDLSPADPFPNTDVAGSFAEYFKIRYDVEVSLDQPMLDVDHTSSRLNFLLPRYQNFKGQHLAIPEKNSKRSKRSKVFMIPELCSIHPVPGYLWRQLSNLPALLYRMESLLVAEELRCRVVRDLGIGAVDWPNDVPLPVVTIGEMMGEEILSEKYSSTGEKNSQRSSAVAEDNPSSSFSTDLPEVFMDLKISNQVELTEKSAAKSLAVELFHDATAYCLSMSSEKFLFENYCTEKECKPLFRPAPHQSPLTFSKEKEDIWPHKLSDFNVPLPTKPRAFDCDSILVDDKESEVSAISIWTDPLLSNFYRTCGPSSSLILRALTTTSAGDVFSLERLEALGDSFEKFAISSSVFFKHRLENEGVLSFLRGIKVSNRQQFYLARRRGLPSYMFTRMFNPLVNWLPPGFYLNDDSNAGNSGYEHLSLIPDTFSDEVDDEEDDESIFAETESSGYNADSQQGESTDVQLNSYLHVCCSDKSIADCTEALIGAFLLCFGSDGAFKFLEWLGMEIARQEKDENLVDNSSYDDFALDSVPKPTSTIKFHDLPHQAPETMVENMSSNDVTVPIPPIGGFSSEHGSTNDEFKDVEEALHYHFHDKSLLLQAFTHCSLPRDYNSVRNSYEQLEFLGDALLDFLVMRHLYIQHRHMSPGELTDLRSAVVNNYSFAVLAVKLGFPRHLRSLSPQLFGMVNTFVVKLKEKEMKHATTHEKNNEIYSSVFVMATEGREDSEQVEVPKALGDLFEAVAGAIYLDCGADLERVWEIYLPILKPSIDYYSDHPPMSAVRRLLEMMPGAAKFSPVERMVDGKFKCTLTVSGCGTFVATGRNFRIAKSTAAQKALRALQRMESETKT